MIEAHQMYYSFLEALEPILPRTVYRMSSESGR